MVKSASTLNSSRLLTEAEAAERLRLSKKALQRRRWAGEPPGWVKIGRNVRYREEVIEALIAAGEVRPGEAA